MTNIYQYTGETWKLNIYLVLWIDQIGSSTVQLLDQQVQLLEHRVELFDKRDKDAPVTPLAERSEITTGETNGIPYSILKIKNAYLEDRKIYICQAILKDTDEDVEDCKESKECDEVETILRVKDPLAAVWPFIGIVAEV